MLRPSSQGLSTWALNLFSPVLCCFLWNVCVLFRLWVNMVSHILTFSLPHVIKTPRTLHVTRRVRFTLGMVGRLLWSGPDPLFRPDCSLCEPLGPAPEVTCCCTVPGWPFFMPVSALSPLLLVPLGSADPCLPGPFWLLIPKGPIHSSLV